jgi:hypothetical protein
MDRGFGERPVDQITNVRAMNLHALEVLHDSIHVLLRHRPRSISPEAMTAPQLRA